MLLRPYAVVLIQLSCVQAPASAGVSGTQPPPPPPPAQTPPASPSRSIVSEIVRLTNVERMRAGRRPLASNAKLMRAAQLQADQMAALSHMDHVLPSARYPEPVDRLAAVGYDWRAFGENVAYGAPDAAGTMQDWMNSSGHRENILSANYTEIGVGYARDASGRPYYAQLFGRPR